MNERMDVWMDGEPIEMCSAVGPSSLNEAQLHVQRAVGPSSLFYCLASTNSGGTSPLLCLARGPSFIKTLILRHLRKNLMVPVTGGSQWTCPRPSPANETGRAKEDPSFTRHLPSHPRHRFFLLLRLKVSVLRSVPHLMPIQYCCERQRPL